MSIAAHDVAGLFKALNVLVGHANLATSRDARHVRHEIGHCHALTFGAARVF